MPDLNRRFLAIAAVSAVLLFLVGFGVGRLTAGDTQTTEFAAGEPTGSTVSSAQVDSTEGEDTTEVSTTDTTPETATDTTQPPIDGDASAALVPALGVPEGGIPVYGTDEEREAFLAGLEKTGVTGSDDDLLAVADHVCYSLERLEAQRRSAAYAVRVVWNESLAELDSEDLAAFGIVFNGAPHFLCPDSIFYGADVAYWLGF